MLFTLNSLSCVIQILYMGINSSHQDLIDKLKHFSCSIPIKACSELFYPDHISNIITDWIHYYKETLRPTIEKINPGSAESDHNLEPSLNSLKEDIYSTLCTYYAGDVLKATNLFNKSIKNSYFDMLKHNAEIETGSQFYRGRIGDKRQYESKDLFHVPFQERYKVSTSRYSIPGLPALYLGDSPFVIWEEFDQHRFREIHFSRLVNSRPLNVIKILRIADLIDEIAANPTQEFLPRVWRYIKLFPITIACSVSVQHRIGVFKPEYIIPQLLLQFVKTNEEFDGIMYPSTKVDYSKIVNVPAYNYVFPVKSVADSGLCSDLVSAFQISQPTSLEIEELIYNTDHTFLKSFPTSNINDKPRQMKYFEGTVRGYAFTSFGLIEERLKERPVASLKEN